MSSELMSASERRVIVPSMITSGSCLPVRLVAARSRIAGSLPGCPDDVITAAPRILP